LAILDDIDGYIGAGDEHEFVGGDVTDVKDWFFEGVIFFHDFLFGDGVVDADLEFDGFVLTLGLVFVVVEVTHCYVVVVCTYG
jgi:hypothetical protein